MHKRGQLALLDSACFSITKMIEGIDHVTCLDKSCTVCTAIRRLREFAELALAEAEEAHRAAKEIEP